MAGFLATSAYAGPYLADQLLLPFALAGGGRFSTVKPSQHSRTAADIIALFTGRRFVFRPQENGTHLVELA
jgi:RNA 3'-terminal phosphate cyclase (ATP)